MVAALDRGRALDAWAAAHELETLSLADALALCLVLVDEDPPRYERAAVRWLSRLAGDPRGLDLGDLLMAVSSLAAMRSGQVHAPLAALDAVLERRGDERAREALAASTRRAL